jgi:hypothetical protein
MRRIVELGLDAVVVIVIAGGIAALVLKLVWR